MPANVSLEHGCPSQCRRRKPEGLAVLLGVSREPRPTPIRGWVANLFCVKTKGVGREDFVTLIRDSSEKAVRQNQGIFLLASPAKSMLWLRIITLLVELGEVID